VRRRIASIVLSLAGCPDTDTPDAADTGTVANESTGVDASGTTGTPGCVDRPLALDGDLADAVAANDGYGGGILRVAGRDCVYFEGAAGVLERDGDPIAVDTGFEVASVTKTFTAVLVMTFVEDGDLALDDTYVAAWGADAPTDLLVIDGVDRTAEITLRQLLGHTSGLPDYWTDGPFVAPDVNAFVVDFDADPDRFWTPEEILAYVPGLDPIGPPGAQYHYGDTGYVMLGMLVERIAGEPYDAVLRARILDPIGMPDTYLTYHEDAPRGLVESHRYEADYDLFHVTRQSADWAGGGLASSTVDLERFMLALVDGEILHDPQSWTAMTTWTPVGEDGVWYGLGLFRVETGIRGDIIGHDGYGNSFMYWASDPDVVFTGTLNQRDTDWYPLFESAMTALPRF
jgi:CubicO group peptidase (beta-lactamase class C family)